MKISVIIPVYNASLLIERCLNSVFQQIGNFDLEVICIDDGSTDNSVNIIQNFSKSITLIQQSNKGPAAARNKGIEIANSKYLAFLDADDYWEPEFLVETVSFLEEHSVAVAVSVGQKHINPLNQKVFTPGFMKKTEINAKSPVILDDFFAFWAEHFHICTGSILIRTKTVKRTGGQRESFRISEDLEYWAYLATFGPIGFIPRVLFVSDGGKVTRRVGWFNKNRIRWASSPTIEKWEKRIISEIKDKDRHSYFEARGRIARNLCYSMIMSNQFNLAKEQCKKYRNDFPKKDSVACLLKFGSINWLFWAIVISIIYYREFLRSIIIKL